VKRFRHELNFGLITVILGERAPRDH